VISYLTEILSKLRSFDRQ